MLLLKVWHDILGSSWQDAASNLKLNDVVDENIFYFWILRAEASFVYLRSTEVCMYHYYYYVLCMYVSYVPLTSPPT